MGRGGGTGPATQITRLQASPCVSHNYAMVSEVFFLLLPTTVTSESEASMPGPVFTESKLVLPVWANYS